VSKECLQLLFRIDSNGNVLVEIPAKDVRDHEDYKKKFLISKLRNKSRSRAKSFCIKVLNFQWVRILKVDLLLLLQIGNNLT